MKEKIVLVGAGSAMFTRGLVSDLINANSEAELALVDVDPEALKVAEGLSAKMIAARKAKVKLSASVRRRDVLRGATAVICTVGVGGRRAWETDVFIPRKYGIFQPVGDTVGPGGASRALRMIPAMVDIAKDVVNLCPRALFFNYGNPMSAVCRGIHKATGASVVGLCHGIPGTAHYVASTLGAAEGDNISPRFSYSAVGINHFTWFTEVGLDGKPAMKELLERGRKILEEAPLYEEGGPKAGEKNRDRRMRFCWQLAMDFGMFPAVGDRHVTEFFPALTFGKGRYFGKTLGIEAYSFEDTIADGDSVFEEMKGDALSDRPLPGDYFERIAGEHEQVMDIIGAIRRNTGEIFSANLPNLGQAPGIMENAVVECPVRATSGGLKPVAQKEMSSGAAGTINSKFACIEATVDAALEGGREKFIQALILDGAVESLETAGKLADELLEAQAKYLPKASGGRLRPEIAKGGRMDDAVGTGPDESAY